MKKMKIEENKNLKSKNYSTSQRNNSHKMEHEDPHKETKDDVEWIGMDQEYE